MERIAISQFKARCLAVLEEVRRGRRSILVTRHGKPVAEVVPPPLPSRASGWLGSLRGTGRITGDVVSPVSAERDWEVLRR